VAGDYRHRLFGVHRRSVFAPDCKASKAVIEAAEALNLSPWRRFRQYRFPQAFAEFCHPWAMISSRWWGFLACVRLRFDATQAAKNHSRWKLRYFKTYTYFDLSDDDDWPVARLCVAWKHHLRENN
jgi:hypothetical protein